MRFDFDTSAFLPCRGKAAAHFSNTWQRYTLDMEEEEWERVSARREELADEANRSGSWAKSRAYDRWIVKKFSV